MTSSSSQPTRFIALDVHKQYIMAGAIDGQQQVVLRPRKLTLDQYDSGIGSRSSQTMWW